MALYGHKHLYWHGRRHCWDDGGAAPLAIEPAPAREPHITILKVRPVSLNSFQSRWDALTDGK